MTQQTRRNQKKERNELQEKELAFLVQAAIEREQMTQRYVTETEMGVTW